MKFIKPTHSNIRTETGFLDWFTTKNGQKFTYFSASTACVAAAFASYLPHTICLDYYVDFLRLYRHGFTVPVSKCLLERFQKTVDLLEIEADKQELYKPFFAYGFDVISAGDSRSKFGIAIGLPPNYEYSSVENIDKSKIKVKLDSVTWSTEEGVSLLNSLILSENAQMYAMAKEMKLRQKPKLIMDTFSATFPCIFAYSIGNSINRKFNLLAKPRVLRLVVYSLVGLFGLGTYAMFNDMSQIYFEQKIDKELCDKNPIFLEGGKEYYSKILQRNIALRKLMGKDGESLYTMLGNENYWFRTPHIPLVQRKAFFEEKALVN